MRRAARTAVALDAGSRRRSSLSHQTEPRERTRRTPAPARPTAGSPSMCLLLAVRRCPPLHRRRCNQSVALSQTERGPRRASVLRRGRRERQGRTPGLKRLRRAAAALDPRGVLAAGVRALLGAALDGARARPRRVPALFQLRPRPHRAPDQGPGARGYRLRGPQDEDREMSAKCRYGLGLGPTRRACKADVRGSSPPSGFWTCLNRGAVRLRLDRSETRVEPGCRASTMRCAQPRARGRSRACDGPAGGG